MNIDKKHQRSLIVRLSGAFLLLYCLFSPLLAAQEPASIDVSREQSEALQRYQTEIEELESEFGPYHQSLLEPLAAMAALSTEQGDYARVTEIQLRQLQLTRTVLGLEHPELIPLLRVIIANQMKLGEWQEVSNNLEHVRHLQAAISGDDSTALLAAIEDQIYWHLTRSYLDEKETRVANFFQARELYRDLAVLAEDSFGENSAEIIPWLYKQAYNKYQLVQFLNASDRVGSQSIDRLVREDGVSRLRTHGRNSIDVDAVFGPGNNIPVVDANSQIGESYLREGYNLVGRIAAIIESEGDLEAAAMARIYQADFQLLQKKGLGMRNYREAQEMLLQAGVSETKIKHFFSRPMAIPVDKFFRRLDDAIAHQQRLLDELEGIPEAQIHLGVFNAWSESLLATRKPVREEPFWHVSRPISQADVSFSVSSRGAVSSVDVIDSLPDERGIRRNASRAVRALQFRPAVIDGRGRRVRDVHLRYRFFVE